MNNLRRQILVAVLAIHALARPTAAQANGWSVGVITAYSDFHGGIHEATGITFEPSSRLEFGASAMRTWDAWELELGASYAPGHLSSRDSTGESVQLDLIGESFPRLRLAPLIGRRLLAIGEGRLALMLGPTLDFWYADQSARTRVGGQTRLTLEAPVGGMIVSNFLGYSISSSPFEDSELVPDSKRVALQAFSVGVEIRLRL